MASLNDGESALNRKPSPSASPTEINRQTGRSNNADDRSCSSFTTSVAAPDRQCASAFVSENLTESVTARRNFFYGLGKSEKSTDVVTTPAALEFLDISEASSDFSACSADISSELHRLASLPSPGRGGDSTEPEQQEPCLGSENVSTEIIESISPEDLQPASFSSVAVNRTDNRALIGDQSGYIPALIPLLRSTDPWTQEHSVTTLLNLSLHEGNKDLITHAGAVKWLVHVLKTGTETSKQSAACALLSLISIEENILEITSLLPQLS